MPKSNVVARVLEGDQLECHVTSPRGETLKLAGVTSSLEPETAVGSDLLRTNPSVVFNAWAFAKFTYLQVHLPSAEEQRAAAKRAEHHREVTEWIADLADEPLDEWRKAWCSGCLTKDEHRKVQMRAGSLPAYLCSNCGCPTLPCAAPGCDYMAIRRQGAVRMPRFCAEHRHELASFEKSADKLESLVDYRDLFTYDESNLSRMTKLVGAGIAGVALAGPAALLAAPAIGGAVGSMIGGFSGAAASSYGLALLGGGSLAAGGAGMAGGAAVVTAVGATLGGAVGATVTNAYVHEDKSFHIEMLHGGPGVPVIVCNGFLSEGSYGWGEWRKIVKERYPDSPVYRVHWGAKELKDLGVLARSGSLRGIGSLAVKEAAAKATKAGSAMLGPLAPVLIAAELVKNPWHVAKNRANKTGAIVADLLARTEAESYVLIGHSLGARAMIVAAEALGTKKDGPRLQDVHLLGAAIGANSEWKALTSRVDGAVFNYHSEHDDVLKWLYATAQGGQAAAGYKGFTKVVPKLHNIDVSDTVEGHSEYHDKVTLR